MSHPRLAAERTALYRLYDVNGELLYVGITNDPEVRFNHHRNAQPWWFQVASHTLEWFASREIAEESERLSIVAELPRWNRDHMPVDLIRRNFPAPPIPAQTEDEKKIEEIAARTRRLAEDQAWIYKTIPEVFPEKHGGEPVRGRLTAVVKATDLTREYVARIRDGKVKPPSLSETPAITHPIGSPEWTAAKMTPAPARHQLARHTSRSTVTGLEALRAWSPTAEQAMANATANLRRIFPSAAPSDPGRGEG